jgi:hypothetical protein
MDTDQILDSVELVAGVDRDGARLAVDATLLTLAERVGRAAAALAGGLPGELEAALTAGPDAGEPFDAEEFARRTAARAGSTWGGVVSMRRRCWPPSARTWPGSRSFATGCRPTTGRCSARRRRPRSAPWCRSAVIEQRSGDTTTLGSPRRGRRTRRRLACSSQATFLQGLNRLGDAALAGLVGLGPGDLEDVPGSVAVGEGVEGAAGRGLGVEGGGQVGWDLDLAGRRRAPGRPRPRRRRRGRRRCSALRLIIGVPPMVATALR